MRIKFNDNFALHCRKSTVPTYHVLSLEYCMTPYSFIIGLQLILALVECITYNRDLRKITSNKGLANRIRQLVATHKNSSIHSLSNIIWLLSAIMVQQDF